MINIPCANTTEMIYIYEKQIRASYGRKQGKDFYKKVRGRSNDEIRQVAQIYLLGIMSEVDAV